jgi:hypothetical protein
MFRSYITLYLSHHLYVIHDVLIALRLYVMSRHDVSSCFHTLHLSDHFVLFMMCTDVLITLHLFLNILILITLLCRNISSCVYAHCWVHSTYYHPNPHHHIRSCHSISSCFVSTLHSDYYVTCSLYLSAPTVSFDNIMTAQFQLICSLS